jgi:hypothetical protein
MAPLLYIELVAVADSQHVFVDGMFVGCHMMPFSVHLTVYHLR